MTTPVSGSRLGEAICDALGIDTRNVRGITIHADVMSAALIEVRRYVGPDEAGSMAEVCSRYTLTEVGP